MAENWERDYPPGVGGGIGGGHEEVPCPAEDGVDHAVVDLKGGEAP